MKRKDKDLEQGSPTPRLRTLLVCPWPVGNRAAQQEVSSQPEREISPVSAATPSASTTASAPPGVVRRQLLTGALIPGARKAGDGRAMPVLTAGRVSPASWSASQVLPRAGSAGLAPGSSVGGHHRLHARGALSTVWLGACPEEQAAKPPRRNQTADPVRAVAGGALSPRWRCQDVRAAPELTATSRAAERRPPALLFGEEAKSSST